MYEVKNQFCLHYKTVSTTIDFFKSFFKNDMIIIVVFINLFTFLTRHSGSN